MSLKANCKTLAKVGDKEEIFVLRAQDYSAPSIILEWLRANFDHLSDDKAREAFECALRMRKHSGIRKVPD